MQVWEIFLRGSKLSVLGIAMGFIGCAVALFVGVMIFSSVSESIDCSDLINNVTQAKCNEVKDISWTIIGILPLALFFVLFTLFGALGRGGETEISTTQVVTNSGKSVLVFLEDNFISFLIVIGLAKVDKGKLR